MIKVECMETWGFEHAIRGMRNPMNSWDKSDSGLGCYKATNHEKFMLCDAECPFSVWDDCTPFFKVGKSDLELMKKLYKAGTEHRKYLRQIFVSMDITAPLYWWKEFDTYKIGTVSNSCSTMHKIHAKEFELDDFSWEHLMPSHDIQIDMMPNPMPFNFQDTLQDTIDALNIARELYLESKDKDYWWQMIQFLQSETNNHHELRERDDHH